MAGLMTFPDLATAIRAGFQIYDRTPNGFIVRAASEKGSFTTALVRTN